MRCCLAEDGKIKYKERTERKLRYAKVHLDELIACPRNSPYDDFQRAHCESFLFHLISARDMFLQEINIAHNLSLKEGHVKSNVVYKKIKSENIKSPAFNELRKLEIEQDPPSWLNEAIYFRNKGAHRIEMSRFIHLGGDDNGKTELICRPKKGKKKRHTSGKDFIEDFINWYNNMTRLIEKLREQLP